MTTKVHFYLFSPKTDQSLIYVAVGTKDGRVRVSTGELIKSDQWISKSKRVSPKGNYGRAHGVNSRLSALESNLVEISNQLKAFNQPLSKNDVITCIRDTRGQTARTVKSESQITFWKFFENFLELERFDKNGLPLKKQTYNSYRVTYQRLSAFEKYLRTKLDFDSFELSLLKKFVSFLYNKPNDNYSEGKKIGLAPNTVALTIKRLKTVLNDATEHGFNVPQSFRKIKAGTVDTTEIALTEEELSKLYHLDLSSETSHEMVRDLFLVGCFTAARFSDYHKINRTNVFTTANGSFLNFKQEKTGFEVIIPVFPILEEILQKYDGAIPYSLPNQVINRYLKVICKQAGINDTVKVIEYDKGQRIEIMKPRYEMVSTHTARRTGATLIYNHTKNIEMCMKLTGHKTAKQFLAYVRNSGQDSADEMAKILNAKGFGNLKEINPSGLKISFKNAG